MPGALVLLALIGMAQDSADRSSPAPAPGKVDASQPPQANLTGLVRTEDYPPEAMAKREEGTVTVLMGVTERGTVAGCEVTTSSGSPSLDSQTCKILSERARFTPATDPEGKPIASRFRQRITWRLQDPIMPADDWSVRTVLTYHRDGKTTSCRWEVTGALKGRGPDSANCDEDEKALADLRTAGIIRAGATTIVTIEQRLLRGRVATWTLPSLPSGHRLLAKQILEISIAADGKVTDCRELSFEGVGTPPPPCAGSYEFTPATDPSGKAVPTKVTKITSMTLRVDDGP